MSFLNIWNTEAMEKVKLVMSHPDAFQSENAIVTDNAVSALGKICEFHRDAIDAAKVCAFKHRIMLLF